MNNLTQQYLEAACKQFDKVVTHVRKTHDVCINESKINVEEMLGFFAMVYYSTQDTALKKMVIEMIKAMIRIKATGASVDSAVARRLAASIR